MNQNKQIEFIPFHAINEFMRNDFRLNIIKKTLTDLKTLDRKFVTPIDQLTRRHVKVAGFRNSVKAPATVKAVAMVKAFESKPRLVAAILEAWAETQPEFRQHVFDLLVDRGWKILPVDMRRSKFPGFLTRWPAEDDYEVLYQAFMDSYPDSDASIDQTSLMIVWLSGRLPIEKINKDEMDFPEVPEDAPTE